MTKSKSIPSLFKVPLGSDLPKESTMRMPSPGTRNNASRGALLVVEYPDTIETLISHGMHCLGCPSSQAESLKDACFVHGLDADKILEAVNKAITEKA